MGLLIAVALLQPALSTASPSGQTDPSAGAPDSGLSPDGIPLGPGDLLEVSVSKAPELSGTVRVSEAGKISLPLVGEVEVRGLTPVQLEARLRVALSPSVADPQVSVLVKEYGSRRVSDTRSKSRRAVAVALVQPDLSTASPSGQTAPSSVGWIPTGVPDSGLSPTMVAEDGIPLGPEDLLEVSVFQVPDLSRTVRVSEAGKISLPLVGEVEVRGLTPVQLEARLQEALSKGSVEDPEVSVFVKEYGSRRVSVIGAVGLPGLYEILGPRTLLQVLSQAGGLTEQSGTELCVLRHLDGSGPKRIAINVSELMSGQDPSLNLQIEPGDVISVLIDPPAYVYVDGAVNSPGRIEQRSSRPLSLLQAIARAGGPTQFANLKEVQILRGGVAEGKQAPPMIVNLKRVRKGEARDPLLKDGDVIIVRESFF